MNKTEQIWKHLAALKTPAPAAAIAADLGFHEPTVRTTLNAFARTEYATVDIDGGVRLFKTTRVNVPYDKVSRAVADNRLANTGTGRTRPPVEHEPSARVLVMVEIPGADTVTLDLEQARHVHTTLSEIFNK